MYDLSRSSRSSEQSSDSHHWLLGRTGASSQPPGRLHGSLSLPAHSENESLNTFGEKLLGPVTAVLPTFAIARKG